MALTPRTVSKARLILQQVVPGMMDHIESFDEDQPVRPGMIIGCSTGDCDGYHTVFTDVTYLSPSQEIIFRVLQAGVDSPSFTQEMGAGITRIGWHIPGMDPLHTGTMTSVVRLGSGHVFRAVTGPQAVDAPAPLRHV